MTTADARGVEIVESISPRLIEATSTLIKGRCTVPPSCGAIHHCNQTETLLSRVFHASSLPPTKRLTGCWLRVLRFAVDAQLQHHRFPWDWDPSSLLQRKEVKEPGKVARVSRTCTSPIALSARSTSDPRAMEKVLLLMLLNCCALRPLSGMPCGPCGTCGFQQTTASATH